MYSVIDVLKSGSQLHRKVGQRDFILTNLAMKFDYMYAYEFNYYIISEHADIPSN